MKNLSQDKSGGGAARRVCQRTAGCTKTIGHRGGCLLRPKRESAARQQQRLQDLRDEHAKLSCECLRLERELDTLRGRLSKGSSIAHAALRRRRPEQHFSAPLTADELRSEMEHLLLADLEADDETRRLESEFRRAASKLEASGASPAAQAELASLRRKYEADLAALRARHEASAEVTIAGLLPGVLSAAPLSSAGVQPGASSSTRPAACAPPPATSGCYATGYEQAGGYPPQRQLMPVIASQQPAGFGYAPAPTQYSMQLGYQSMLPPMPMPMMPPLMQQPTHMLQPLLLQPPGGLTPAWHEYDTRPRSEP